MSCKAQGSPLTNRQIKLVVVDLDGTLINSRGQISSADKTVIAAAKSGGIAIALSTGRVVDACRQYIADLSLDGAHIFFDGALIYNPTQNTTIALQPIDPGLLAAAVRFARANSIYLELYALDRYFVEEINWADAIHREFFGLRSTHVNFDEIIGRELIIKCELMIHNQDEELKARLFLDHFTGSLRGSVARTPAYPNVKFINVVNPAVSKGTALVKLAAYLNLDLDQVMAIGDGINDLSLLGTAGLAVAMGNASDELKACADFVTSSVDLSGVALAISRFVLSRDGET
ncbi:Cof-type HAD-IIB family hydrolase [Dehalogenimonas alkenigignens]|uniref:HAD-superfamily hydrolase, subfamily IIB n=1 Tax=Dehalogenimonas alkenigignens TaxID=1217799 RepID=A0A0W0GJW8_9CHLR|nr:Cof-type HAD-IIB family hydrolase [Dehalogenimonas alkenigignens]KTB48852.1 HAD-superfamily hydrolase, subfamily IIB [Dehalogenimonas alkenigignens]PVV84740.1 Cof-type HAD-IIB family hydrolase [Dehalogenimonas alkenigignens]